jgi:hypothetical protein
MIFSFSGSTLATTTTTLEQQKTTAHEIAEMARSIGLPENDPIIVRAKQLWEEANKQFCIDRDIIATVIFNEAWGGCSERHRELVAAVVCNRVASDKFPNTVYEVVTQPRQYIAGYVDPNSYYGRLARQNSEVWLECQRIATKALRGEIDCPSNVVFQAEFKQGSNVYEIHRTSYSTSYFCYL